MNPYISFVIVGRNDGYGENFLDRINLFIKSLDWQVQNYPNIFELIIVEWNPLDDYPSFAEVLHKPKHLSTRIITVSKELHDQTNSKLPVLEFCGKNVGIRRAHGEFVLITNPDIIFSQELIDELAKQNLDKNCFYRTDRHDYHGDGIMHLPEKDFIPFAVKHCFVSYTEGFSIPSADISELHLLPKTDPNVVRHFNACGDFILAPKYKFFECDGLWEATHQKWHMDSYSLCRLMSTRLTLKLFVAPMCIFHMHHHREPPDAACDSIIVGKILDRFNVLDSENQKNWGLKDIVLPEIKLT